ncbi:3-hydroxyacyl-CoA dehydrogenase, partial [bacterium]|nr:3-hydroxyacyl-CoA dehydrogenase [bacterium]
MRNVTILGGGVLGSQIAFQTAYSGFNVTIYLRSEGSIERCKPKLAKLKENYINAINLMAKDKSYGTWCNGIASIDEFDKDTCLKKVEEAANNIKLELDLEKAVADADLVIESMSEEFEAKKELFIKLAPLLPSKTILVTNSSTMLPSHLAKYTKREEKFLALHFANSIWKNNIAEVMKQSKTKEEYFNIILKFAKDIKMLPLPVRKEKSGYLLNSMLIPFLFSALDLVVNEISDPASIDKAWTVGTGAPEGP